jgi:hypothetical protein
VAMDYSASSVAAGTCVNIVTSRCLAIDSSGFQASCHNIISTFTCILCTNMDTLFQEFYIRQYLITPIREASEYSVFRHNI